MIDIADVNNPIELVHFVNHAPIANAISEVVLERPLQSFDVRVGFWIGAQLGEAAVQFSSHRRGRASVEFQRVTTHYLLKFFPAVNRASLLLVPPRSRASLWPTASAY